jgi:hypothetical protein
MYHRPAYATPLGGEQQRYSSGGQGGGNVSFGGMESPSYYQPNMNGSGGGMTSPTYGSNIQLSSSLPMPLSAHVRYGSATPLTSSNVAVAPPLLSSGANRYVRAATSYAAPPPAQVIHSLHPSLLQHCHSVTITVCHSHHSCQS